ncbi:zf-HC2 domain-containing protein [bacterium]|nr:zf-HC2 domain-containing protein [bacterium]
MDCHLFGLLIQKYHDGELERATEVEFETHLAECEKCRELESNYFEAFSALENMGFSQPLPGFNNRVMARVNVRKYRKSIFSLILGRISRRVNLLPGYIRVTGAVIGAFALFMYIFRPVFLYMLSAGDRLIAFTSTLAAIIKQSGAVFDIVVNYFKSDHEFVLAVMILFRKLKEIAGEIPIGYFATAFVLVCLIVLMIARISRSSWRKGESHVSFI